MGNEEHKYDEDDEHEGQWRQNGKQLAGNLVLLVRHFTGNFTFALDMNIRVTT